MKILLAVLALAVTPFEAEQERLLAQAEAQLAADPANAEAMIWKGRRLAYLGRLEDAIVVFQEGEAAHPADARFARHLGHRLMSLRRFSEASEVLERAAALAAAQPDAVEPDGMPNEAGIPTSTLKGNIYYHLGLARYLSGDFKAAARAYEAASALADNPDAAAAARYWLYLSLHRAGERDAARVALAGVDAGWKLIENEIYHRLALCFRDEADCGAILEAARTSEGIDFATPAYGVAMKRLLDGDQRAARALLREIADREAGAAFGRLAAEADLARRRK